MTRWRGSIELYLSCCCPLRLLYVQSAPMVIISASLAPRVLPAPPLARRPSHAQRTAPRRAASVRPVAAAAEVRLGAATEAGAGAGSARTRAPTALGPPPAAARHTSRLAPRHTPCHTPRLACPLRAGCCRPGCSSQGLPCGFARHSCPWRTLPVHLRCVRAAGASPSSINQSMVHSVVYSGTGPFLWPLRGRLRAARQEHPAPLLPNAVAHAALPLRPPPHCPCCRAADCQGAGGARRRHRHPGRVCAEPGIQIRVPHRQVSEHASEACGGCCEALALQAAALPLRVGSPTACLPANPRACRARCACRCAGWTVQPTSRPSAASPSSRASPTFPPTPTAGGERQSGGQGAGARRQAAGSRHQAQDVAGQVCHAWLEVGCG